MTYPPPPYKDAVCGGPVAGEAICGKWWAYALNGGLAFGSSTPQIVFGDIVPSAGLAFGSVAPTLYTETRLAAPAAGLAFGSSAPSYAASSTLFPPEAGLAFGADLAGIFVGQVFLFDEVCTDLDMTAAPVLSLDLDDLVCLP